MGFGETVAVEGPGSDALKKARLRSVKRNKPALELPNTGADRFMRGGASPSMRERRINRSYDASRTVWLQAASEYMFRVQNIYQVDNIS
jgi:hypothetical protein